MIETNRLIIRPFTKTDAKAIYEACNDFDIFKTTLGIPSPYTLDEANHLIYYTKNSISNQKPSKLEIK